MDVVRGRLRGTDRPRALETTEDGDLHVALSTASGGGSAGDPLYVRGGESYDVSRHGTPVCRWVNDLVNVAALTVLAVVAAGDQPGIFYDLAPGETVYVTQFCYELHTNGDDLRVEIGYTAQPGAAGTFRPVTPVHRVATGAANDGFVPPYKRIAPPLPLRYADGVRCVTMRVQANDAAAQVMVAWHGFREGG